MRLGRCAAMAVSMSLWISSAALGAEYTLYAGGGNHYGDGMPATRAVLDLPRHIAYDTSGNLYVADSAHNRVRKVDASGRLVTVAGSDRICCGIGDGEPATQALLSRPEGVTVDASGNVLIADTNFGMVRRVDAATGIIATVAGNGQGCVFPNGDGGPATHASLCHPTDVAVGPRGDIFVADPWAHRIRRVDAVTGRISTVAGSGLNQSGDRGDFLPATLSLLDNPYGIEVSPAGELHIADTGNDRVRKISFLGIMLPVAGTGDPGYDPDEDGGPALAAKLSAPVDVAFGPDRSMYVADQRNQRIRVVSFPGPQDAAGIIDTFAGNGAQGRAADGTPATEAPMRYPNGVAASPGGTVAFADLLNNQVRVVRDGTVRLAVGDGGTWTNGDGGDAAVAAIDAPQGLARVPGGDLVVAERGGGRVRAIDSSSTIRTLVSGANVPYDVAASPQGEVHFANGFTYQVWAVSASGATRKIAGTGLGYSGDGGPATSARMSVPLALTFDPSGNLYIATADRRVRKVDTNGIITTFAGTGAEGSTGDGGPATAARLQIVVGLASDAAGNVYLADLEGHRVRKVDTNGIITTFAGGGSFTVPELGDGGPAASAYLYRVRDVAAAADGSLYIADSGHGRIRRVGSDGIISTVAFVALPYGIAIADDGDLFVSQAESNRILRVRPD